MWAFAIDRQYFIVFDKTQKEYDVLSYPHYPTTDEDVGIIMVDNRNPKTPIISGYGGVDDIVSNYNHPLTSLVIYMAQKHMELLPVAYWDMTQLHATANPFYFEDFFVRQLSLIISDEEGKIPNIEDELKYKDNSWSRIFGVVYHGEHKVQTKVKTLVRPILFLGMRDGQIILGKTTNSYHVDEDAPDIMFGRIHLNEDVAVDLKPLAPYDSEEIRSIVPSN
jgi:hypothetical protein